MDTVLWQYDMYNLADDLKMRNIISRFYRSQWYVFRLVDLCLLLLFGSVFILLQVSDSPLKCIGNILRIISQFIFFSSFCSDYFILFEGMLSFLRPLSWFSVGISLLFCFFLVEIIMLCAASALFQVYCKHCAHKREREREWRENEREMIKCLKI